ncbi:MAG: NYN domain-containing protein [Bryobacteraceae bacterium]|nr:NYN domain-containing protein [Bryobacteraceae bacterium]MDW8379824.1 NYN domain-containing protein [Bryobacterales bacterium]
MQEKLNIAVFVDYDNIEIGVKSTLRRDFDVSLALDALKERGDIVAKFAYANWSRQDLATRQMAENAVQMVQRNPSPRGDKNGADINLALDALEMAFTHPHVNAFAIISGDSDFIPLVNKLREFGKRIFIVGGKAFTSTILQQNCHEFISYESLLDARGEKVSVVERRDDRNDKGAKREDRFLRNRPAPLELAQAMPLVERALQVLERREVKAQLGLLKSTMLQLDPAFSEKAYGANSFSEFVEKLKKAGLIETRGHGGHYTIERKGAAQGPMPKPEDALPTLRELLENHRLELEDGRPAEELAQWMAAEFPQFDIKTYGFQEFGEFLTFAQDSFVVRLERDQEKGTTVFLGAEFYPPALPPPPEPDALEEEEDGPQPYVEGQPTMMDPNPQPPKPATAKKRAPRKAQAAEATKTPRKTVARRKKA